MKLEDIALSEIYQTQKDQCWPSCCQRIETESRIMVARGWGRGKQELFNWYRISVSQDENVLEIGWW